MTDAPFVPPIAPATQAGARSPRRAYRHGQTIDIAGRRVPRLGMGCWAIGGPFFAGDKPLGYAHANDADSRRAIRAALEAGVRLFDTADVYGAGHSETLLGEELAGRPDAVVVTKLGLDFDADSRSVIGPNADPGHARRAVEASLRRLRRERLDLVLLHINELPLEQAQPIFDTLDGLYRAGTIGGYGWSTDFPESARAMAGRPGFKAVEHAANLFVPATAMHAVAAAHGLVGLIRSPLAMGLLTGKFADGAEVALDDVRANDPDWMDYFEKRRANPRYTARLEAVRDLLTEGGRTLAQGAIGWLWARSPRAVPLPGARTAEQMHENAGALDHGPLPADTMAEIESLIEREPEGPPRPR